MRLLDPSTGFSSPAPLSTSPSPSPPKAPILREPGSRNRGGGPRYLSDLDAVSGPPKPQFPPTPRPVPSLTLPTRPSNRKTPVAPEACSPLPGSRGAEPGRGAERNSRKPGFLEKSRSPGRTSGLRPAAGGQEYGPRSGGGLSGRGRRGTGGAPILCPACRQVHWTQIPARLTRPGP